VRRIRISRYYFNRITNSWREIKRKIISRSCSSMCEASTSFLYGPAWRHRMTSIPDPTRLLGHLFWSALYRTDVRSIVAAVTSALENSYDTQYGRTRDKARQRLRERERVLPSRNAIAKTLLHASHFAVGIRRFATVLSKFIIASKLNRPTRSLDVR